MTTSSTAEAILRAARARRHAATHPESRALIEELLDAMRPRWWIATGRLDQGGDKVAGPFTTFNDALTARPAIEALAGVTYWIDQEPTT